MSHFLKTFKGIFIISCVYITVSEAVSTKMGKCEHTMVGEIGYRRHLIANIDGYPTKLVEDSRNGNIFFMLHKRNFTKGLHVLHYGSLSPKKVPIAADLKAQCVAVDAPNQMVYIGTNQGLATYDYSKTEINSEKLIGEDDVRDMFLDHENHLYLITGSLHEVLRIANGTNHMKRYEKVPKAYQMVMDKKGNIFYEYIDGKLYFFSNDLYEPVQYKGFTRDLTMLLDVRNDDEAIVSVREVIFKLTTNQEIPIKIGHLGLKVTALKFEKNGDFLVGTKGKIFRYKVIKDNDPCPSDDYY